MNMYCALRKRDIKTDICGYIVFMVTGLVISARFFDGVSYVFWFINLIGWPIFLARYVRKLSRDISIICCVYFITGIISILVNLKYVQITLKSIGTSLGLIIVPLYLILFDSLKKTCIISKDDLIGILNLMSIIGSVLLFFSLIIGYSDYLNVIKSSLSVYSANVTGLLKNKNMYGILLAYSAESDLFLTKLKYNKAQNWFFFSIKTIGVVFSFSRAALLHLMIVVIFMLWFEKRRNLRQWVFLAAIIIVGIVVYINNSSIQNFVTKTIIRLDTGDAGRSAGRQQSLDAVTGNFINVILGTSYFGIDFLNIDIDNSYLHIFFSGGALKICFYLYWISRSLYSIKRQKNRSIFIMCLAISISYYAYAYFESVPLLELGIVPFWTMIFMFILPDIYRERIEEDDNRCKNLYTGTNTI